MRVEGRAQMTQAEQRFRTTVRVIVEGGGYPSPGRIRRCLGQTTQPHNLNGWECRWREQELQALGWAHRNEGLTRWVPPGGESDATAVG